MSGKLFSQPTNVNPKEFVNICERNISRVSNKLDDYLTRQDEKNIHDIRTSVRRLDACYQTLPKKLRGRKQMKKFVKKSKDLFKINSQIRDFDIITELIGKNNTEHGSRNSLVLNFENRRAQKLENAKVIAMGLRKLPLPKVKKKSVPKAKLTKRFNKLISKLGGRIQLNLPLVTTDPDKVAELHELRKDCKKLRYLLELVSHDNSSGNIISKMEEELQNMQDLLGAIHDCDATVVYLKRQKRQKTNEIIEDIVQERKKRYENFLAHFKSNIMNNKHSSFMLGIPKMLPSSER
ncbi:MAG: CHAD domain-containing protein [Nitrososphaeraceae archaeon]|jgi:CHAD domain-containing protein